MDFITHKIIKYIDGCIYKGECKDGKLNGYGEMTYSDGRYYEGMWTDGKPNGYGKIFFQDGIMFTGEWTDGTIQNYSKSEGNQLLWFASYCELIKNK